MLNVKTIDPEKYIGLVQKGKPKNETYQKIRKDIKIIFFCLDLSLILNKRESHIHE
jgi:hypothetical protein